jgi:hypothetical protein
MRNMLATMFMCLMMACGVESRGASSRGEVEMSTEAAELTGAAEQVCLSQCLQDCGAVCPGGSGKAACIAECRADNLECRDYCRNL